MIRSRLKNNTSKSEDLVRNSHSQMFFKIGALKNFATFTGRHLCWSLFIKRDSNTGVFL